MEKLGVWFVSGLLHFTLGEAKELNAVFAPATANTVGLLVEFFVWVGFVVVGWLVLVKLVENGVCSYETLAEK